MKEKLLLALKALAIISFYFLIDYVMVLYVGSDFLKIRSNILVLNVVKLALVFAFIVLIDWRHLKNEIQEYKNNHQNVGQLIIKKVFYGFLVLLGVKAVCGIVSTSLVHVFGSNVTDTENQQLIESFLGSFPSLMILSACVFAPLVEELVFRGAIRKVLKNKGVFIAVSGITFGLVHISGSFLLFLTVLTIGVLISEIIEMKKNNGKFSDIIKVLIPFVIVEIIVFIGLYGILYAKDNSITLSGAFISLFTQVGNALSNPTFIIELINDIPYIGMGCYLAYLYTKEDNILINIGVHACNNVFGAALLLLMK